MLPVFCLSFFQYLRKYITPIQWCCISLYFRHSVHLSHCCAILQPYHSFNTLSHCYSVHPVLRSCNLTFFCCIIFSTIHLSSVPFSRLSVSRSIVCIVLPPIRSSAAPALYPSVFPLLRLFILPSLVPSSVNRAMPSSLRLLFLSLIVRQFFHFSFPPSQHTKIFISISTQETHVYCINKLLNNCIIAMVTYDIIIDTFRASHADRAGFL